MAQIDLFGLAWALSGQPLPALLDEYSVLAGALTPCALFAIGLGLHLDGLRDSAAAAVTLALLKLIALPAVVLALALALGIRPCRPWRRSCAPPVPDRQERLYHGRGVPGRARTRAATQSRSPRSDRGGEPAALAVRPGSAAAGPAFPARSAGSGEMDRPPVSPGGRLMPLGGVPGGFGISRRRLTPPGRSAGAPTSARNGRCGRAAGGGGPARPRDRPRAPGSGRHRPRSRGGAR